MKFSLVLTAALLVGAAPAAFAQSSLNLGNYRLSTTFSSAPSSEPSGITYNPDRDTLAVIGDGGANVVEYNRATGAVAGVVNLTNYPVRTGVRTNDTEGLAYLGNNTYMIASERIETLWTFQTTFPTPSQTVNISALNPIYLFGPNANVGNVGIEGVTFNPVTGQFFAVKETSPQGLFRFTYDPQTFAVTIAAAFPPTVLNNLNVADLADIYSLAATPAYRGTALEDHLLVLSQASSRLFELDGNGNIVSQLDLSSIGTTIEGVTIANDGTIYLVEDGTNRLDVLRAVPEPGTVGWLTVGALVLLALAIRHRRAQADAVTAA